MKYFFFLLSFFLSVASVNSQVLKPVKWSFESKHIAGDEFVLIFKAKMDKNWAVYSQYLESDDGPVRTSFEYDSGSHFKKIGKNIESGHKKEGFDEIFEMNVIKFIEEVDFKQKIQVLDYSKPITGYLTFMTCDNTQCLPPTEVDFSFKLEKVSEKPQEPETPKPVKEEKTKTSTPKTSQIEKKTPSKIEKKEVKIAETKIEDKAKGEPTTQKRSGFLQPVKWSYEVKKVSGEEYDLIFRADIDKGWTIYSQFTDDNGPIATSFTFDEGSHYELIGKTKEEGKKKEGPDPYFGGVTVSKFVKGPVIFTQKVKVSDTSKPVKGFLEFMSCDAKQCLPPETIDFSFDVSKTGVITSETTSETGTLANANNNPVTKHKFDQELSKSNCIDNEPAEEDSTSWFWIFLAGIGGGLFAILTPCVFPMIPLTVSFFTKSSIDKKSGLKNAFAYGLSIIVIYVALGLLVTGIFGADALNLLSTNAWFNLFFALLFIVFAISFFGYFEITLPSSWANKTDKLSGRGGLIGIFFMAFTLALVSFSCTGPIIGTLLVQAAKTGFTGPFFGMLGFSIALAFPFALFAMFPSWLNSLPKSGGWMNTVKVTLGFVEMALALKFISIADLTMGWKIMPYELFVGLWVLIAVLLAMYYFGILKFKLDSIVKKLSLSRMIAGGLLLLFAIYLGSGFQYDARSETFKTPNLLSGLAPPPGHSYIYSKHCPLNINCFHNYDEGIAYAKKQGKPVLLDFTGYGCVNCRRMEDNIWSQDEIYDLISDKYVLISLYVDDRKKLDEPYMSEFSNRKMRTVGNKWADFQATHFNRNSQPYYVLTTSEGKVLNQPVAYTPDVSTYRAFLECGLERFAELKTGGKLGSLE